MQISFWEYSTFFKNVDVVIIGSGIVGLNAALSLKRKNKKLKIIILERGILPSGASSKNAGFACFGSVSELLDDLTKYPENEVFKTVEKRWKGLERLRKNLGDKAIDFHNWGGYEIFDSVNEFERCEAKIKYLNSSLAPLTGKKNIYKTADKKINVFQFHNVKHMILNGAEGQIDTGKMNTALISKVRNMGVEILNGFHVKDVEDNGRSASVISSDGFRISCKKIIIATNGFARQLLPDEPVDPARAQVLVTSPVKGLKLKGTFHYQNGYYYFRNIGDRVLLGGGRNLDFKNEQTTDFGLTTIVQNKLENLLKEIILPKQKYSIEMRWSGIMGVGPAKKSIVKPVSKNIFCAVRMGGMGVAIGSLVGEEAALMVEKTL